MTKFAPHPPLFNPVWEKISTPLPLLSTPHLQKISTPHLHFDNSNTALGVCSSTVWTMSVPVIGSQCRTLVVKVVIDSKLVYMFRSAEGVWKAGGNVQIVYRLGPPTQILFSMP